MFTVCDKLFTPYYKLKCRKFEYKFTIFTNSIYRGRQSKRKYFIANNVNINGKIAFEELTYSTLQIYKIKNKNVKLLINIKKQKRKTYRFNNTYVLPVVRKTFIFYLTNYSKIFLCLDYNKENENIFKFCKFYTNS